MTAAVRGQAGPKVQRAVLEEIVLEDREEERVVSKEEEQMARRGDGALGMLGK